MSSGSTQFPRPRGRPPTECSCISLAVAGPGIYDSRRPSDNANVALHLYYYPRRYRSNIFQKVIDPSSFRSILFDGFHSTLVFRGGRSVVLKGRGPKTSTPAETEPFLEFSPPNRGDRSNLKRKNGETRRRACEGRCSVPTRFFPHLYDRAPPNHRPFIVPL